jgi:hypothetical protein
MGRIGDSDDAIQEYNEVQLREQMLREKRNNEAKITKSFNEVMQQKGRAEAGRGAQAEASVAGQPTEGRSEEGANWPAQER